jgi:hypothetical protein
LRRGASSGSCMRQGGRAEVGGAAEAAATSGGAAAGRAVSPPHAARQTIAPSAQGNVTRENDTRGTVPGGSGDIQRQDPRAGGDRAPSSSPACLTTTWKNTFSVGVLQLGAAGEAIVRLGETFRPSRRRWCRHPSAGTRRQALLAEEEDLLGGWMVARSNGTCTLLRWPPGSPMGSWEPRRRRGRRCRWQEEP